MSGLPAMGTFAFCGVSATAPVETIGGNTIVVVVSAFESLRFDFFFFLVRALVLEAPSPVFVRS